MFKMLAAFVLIGIYLDEASFSSARGIYLDLGGTDVCKRSFHVLRDGGLDSGDQSCEGNHAAVSSLAEVLKSAGVSMRPARLLAPPSQRQSSKVHKPV